MQCTFSTQQIAYNITIQKCISVRFKHSLHDGFGTLQTAVQIQPKFPAGPKAINRRCKKASKKSDSPKHLPTPKPNLQPPAMEIVDPVVVLHLDIITHLVEGIQYLHGMMLIMYIVFHR